MQLISKFDKGFRFFLCAIDIFSKYACVVPLKVKKGVSIANAFQKVRLANQTKYCWTKEVNFTIVFLKNGYKIRILKCIRYITKENLLLLKGSLEL